MFGAFGAAHGGEPPVHRSALLLTWRLPRSINHLGAASRFKRAVAGEPKAYRGVLRPKRVDMSPSPLVGLKAPLLRGWTDSIPISRTLSKLTVIFALSPRLGSPHHLPARFLLEPTNSPLTKSQVV
jgi:hypothetical protein